MRKTETVVETEGWVIDKITDPDMYDRTEDDPHVHYVLRLPMIVEHVSIPFDEVRASGGHIHLNYHDERSSTFTGVVDGNNRYKSDSLNDMPKGVFTALKEIGPY